MEKIKQFIDSEKGKDILIVIIVILVGLGSFELGRLSKEDSSSGVKIEYPNYVAQYMFRSTYLSINTAHIENALNYTFELVLLSTTSHY